MTTAVLAFVVMGALVAAMSIGVVMGRKPISGSCGGMKSLGLDVECEICGGNPALCDSTSDDSQSASRQAKAIATTGKSPEAETAPDR